MALYCPDPANHHQHTARPVPDWVPPEPPWDEIRADITAGNYSIRGLAHRYQVSRHCIRGLLWDLVPWYMGDPDLLMGPNRLTNRDHHGNRQRRRKTPYVAEHSYDWDH